MREYDLIAEWYASERVDQTGVPEAIALASSIPQGSLVLDVGCGNGVPITRALLSENHRVVGLDSSSAMLAHLKRNCPEAFAVRGIVESCPFAEAVFDAARVGRYVPSESRGRDSGNCRYLAHAKTRRTVPLYLRKRRRLARQRKQDERCDVSVFLLQRGKLPPHPRRSRLHLGGRSRGQRE